MTDPCIRMVSKEQATPGTRVGLEQWAWGGSLPLFYLRSVLEGGRLSGVPGPTEKSLCQVSNSPTRTVPNKLLPTWSSGLYRLTALASPQTLRAPQQLCKVSGIDPLYTENMGPAWHEAAIYFDPVAHSLPTYSSPCWSLTVKSHGWPAPCFAS